MAFRNGNTLSCLSKTHPSMCKNCVQYAKEMTNKRYNKIIKALTNDQGNFDLARGHRFEVLFVKELNKRNLNNYWRTDKMLQNHIHNKIVMEMEKKENDILKKVDPEFFRVREMLVARPSNALGASNNKNKTSFKVTKPVKTVTNMKDDMKDDLEDEVVTIGTVPDSGVCRNYWNPGYYQLDMEEQENVEDLYPELS